MENYPIESVPDEDKLFFHIPKAKFVANEFDFMDVPPEIFTPQGEDFSTNWERYCSTAQICLDTPSNKYPNGRTTETHGVGHFLTKEVREIEFLEVIHTPTQNRAHTSIKGIPPRKPKPPFNEMRVNLKRIFKWDILPSHDSEKEDEGEKRED